MIRSRLHAVTLAAALLAGALALRFASPAHAQQLGEGMDRSGTVGIQSEAERLLFGTLICTCGCPREALSTCTCGYATERRDWVRTMMAKGMTMEAIQDEYVKRYGGGSLAVPPNSGSSRLVWLVPLLSIAAMAGFVGVTLKRLRRAPPAPPPGPPVAPGGDEYDRKLDDELAHLDGDDE